MAVSRRTSASTEPASSTEEVPLDAFDTVLHGGMLVFPDEGVRAGSIGVKDGRIAVIAAPGQELRGEHRIDCTGKLVLPGLIDPHVHFGFGSPETDFQTETRSAALGGVTTVISFFRTADFRSGFEAERAKAERLSLVDFGLSLRRHRGPPRRDHARMSRALRRELVEALPDVQRGGRAREGVRGDRRRVALSRARAGRLACPGRC